MLLHQFQNARPGALKHIEGNAVRKLVFASVGAEGGGDCPALPLPLLLTVPLPLLPLENVSAGGVSASAYALFATWQAGLQRRWAAERNVGFHFERLLVCSSSSSSSSIGPVDVGALVRVANVCVSCCVGGRGTTGGAVARRRARLSSRCPPRPQLPPAALWLWAEFSRRHREGAANGARLRAVRIRPLPDHHQAQQRPLQKPAVLIGKADFALGGGEFAHHVEQGGRVEEVGLRLEQGQAVRAQFLRRRLLRARRQQHQVAQVSGSAVSSWRTSLPLSTRSLAMASVSSHAPRASVSVTRASVSVPDRAQRAMHGVRRDMPVRIGQHLFQNGERVAPGAFRAAGDGLNRFRFRREAFRLNDALHGRAQVVDAAALELVPLAARADGDRNFVVFGRGENEDDVRRRLFQRFQQGVERFGATGHALRQ